MKVICVHYDLVKDKNTGFMYEPKKIYEIEDVVRGAELVTSGYFVEVPEVLPAELVTNDELVEDETDENDETTTNDEEKNENVDYSKMTVEELKAVAIEKNIDVNGMKKAEIIEALTK